VCDALADRFTPLANEGDSLVCRCPPYRENTFALSFFFLIVEFRLRKGGWCRMARRYTCLIVFNLLTIASLGCGAGASDIGPVPDPTPSPTPGPAPVVAISVNPAVVAIGQSANLTWSSANSSACTASGSWIGSQSTSGTQVETLTAAGNATFVLNCTGAGGSSSGTATLLVTPAVGGAGATLPFVEYEAETANTNGTIIGPDTTFGTLASEASGRRAVQLNATGQYVSFTTAHPTNSIVVRSAIPDAPSGGGISATLGLYINNIRTQSLQLTSRYTWVYGGKSNSSDKNPSDGGAHHFYDEVHALIGEIPAGSTIALQRDATDTAEFYVIDLVDFEEVPAPLTQPAGSLSIADFGAAPNDGTDDRAAIQTAISAAQSQGKVLWIPPGIFNIKTNTGPLVTSGVSIRGAGMWYSQIVGPGAHFAVSGNNNQFSDFAVFADIVSRNDNNPYDDGFHGQAGTGSTMQNVWIEHTKVGWWVDAEGVSSTTVATNGLLIHGVRIRDTYADGINFCCGTSNSIVEQSHFRNTGDDALASWSAVSTGVARHPTNTGNTFRFNTVQTNWRARCISFFGGDSNSMHDNLCSDTVDSAGIEIGEEFASYPFTGTTTAQRNTIIRAGATFVAGEKGGFQIVAIDSPISGVVVQDTLIQDSIDAGILFQGPFQISGVTLSNIQDSGAVMQGILVTSNATGSAQISGIVVLSPTGPALENDAGTSWIFMEGAGNYGF